VTEEPPDPPHVIAIRTASRLVYTHRLAIVAALLAGAVLVILGNGFHFVRNGQRGVLRRFGRVVDGQVAPGLTYVTPLVERLDLVDAGAVTAIPFGESLAFITGDENVVDVRGQIHCRIDDPGLFLTAAPEPDKIIRTAAEQLVTQDVAWRHVDDILTTDRSAIQETVRSGLQATAAKSRLGMTIIGVTLEAVAPPQEAASAFAAVADAASERERRINETQGKAAQGLSLARAEADEHRRQADAAAAEQMERARSSASAFVALAEESHRARAATDQRLYRKAVERLLAEARVILLPGDGSREHLRLDLNGRVAPPPAQTAPEPQKATPPPQ
jgi:HflK protein